jgi:hypothetical protein
MAQGGLGGCQEGTKRLDGRIVSAFCQLGQVVQRLGAGAAILRLQLALLEADGSWPQGRGREQSGERQRPRHPGILTGRHPTRSRGLGEGRGRCKLGAMTKEILAQALESEGLSAGNQGYTIPENREALCLVGAPGEIFSVDKVVRLDLREKHVVLENSRRERFFFAYDVILGLRIVGASGTRGAGFAR